MPAVSENLIGFPQGFDDRLEELRRSRTLLLQEIEAAKTASAPGLSGSNAWSASEVVYHVHLSEKSIARMLKRALESTARGTAAHAEQLRAEWERIRKLVGTSRAKMQAPPRVVPEKAPNLADGIELLRESRQQLLAAIGNATYDDLLSVSMPHPFQVVGTLTGAGWLSLVAYHDLRHAEQVRELGAATKPQRDSSPPDKE
jgi:DinB superfamily